MRNRIGLVPRCPSSVASWHPPSGAPTTHPALVRGAGRWREAKSIGAAAVFKRFFAARHGELTTTQIIMLVITVMVLVALIVFAVAIKGFGTENVGFLNAVTRGGA